jgi:hypothetical protein
LGFGPFAVCRTNAATYAHIAMALPVTLESPDGMPDGRSTRSMRPEVKKTISPVCAPQAARLPQSLLADKGD